LKLEYYLGEESIIEDYEEFLRKIVKYHIDEKDFNVKERYFKILKILNEKTPYNIHMELQIS
jgi:hypothetical protein